MKSLNVDTRMMRRALRLAERGRGRTRPNPPVGAVVVRGDRIVGEGWHRAAGEPHAEVLALDAAGRRARGATLVVTLEPCCHEGRTPPCTNAVLAAGVARCVIAMRDPNPQVNGRGMRILRRAGVELMTGVCGAEARELLGGYVLAHTEGRPRVTWKVASTLDGRIADASGRARWITGPEARRHGHGLRRVADAIVIGAGTARTDDPRLTVRAVRTPVQPLRVVCDSRLRLPTTLALFGPRLAGGTIVACTRNAPRAAQRRLEAAGVTVWRLAAGGGGVSPRALAKRLAAHGVHEVLLEGGAALGTSWLRAGRVDRIAMYTAPRVIGSEGLDWCDGLGIRSLGRAVQGRISRVRRLGEDTFQMMEIARRTARGQ
jgi:diaminohydroxyphosphoribosylaminopyrimidine deaminase/5-amino-6-(5-phosphoribosylamino)uracil reductase